jgi:hypothetical protein
MINRLISSAFALSAITLFVASVIENDSILLVAGVLTLITHRLMAIEDAIKETKKL